MELFIQKGMLTRDEVNRVRAEADAIRTNGAAMPESSKWKISNAIKNVELFGDLRLRYEHRQVTTPANDRLELDRGRAAVRVGLRGDAFDNFYYGVRLETSSNPRSPWVTFGSSSPGPFGKSGFGINLGQVYLGWRPADWVDITVGKMDNLLYTTPMVWDTDINPEGAFERFKYSVGPADFFATFGQFLYQDNNPSYISGSLISSVSPNGARQQQNSDLTFMLAWQGGVNVHLPKDTSVKVAPAVYHYFGLMTNTFGSGVGDAFVGEGSYGGPGSPAPIIGLTSQGSVSYNQIGVNNLVVLDIPFEFNFKIASINARVFGDYAYNFQGGERADAAFNALGSQALLTGSSPPLLKYGSQRNDNHAYQAGLDFGTMGLVYGTTSRRHAWEVRAYWQHVEQYALDPNLLDSDFFEGRGNMEGFYTALAYGFTDNVIGTFRYGYAWRINDRLGTGGSNLDIPQINPISRYNILQLDLTLRF